MLSGAMHYFRVMPQQWPQRLGMLRAMGLNTVETYVPWNWHEPRRGRFERLEQLGDFLTAAREAGLDAIVRPGPYICAEWDNGGLPWWLEGPLRCSAPAYLKAVDDWFDVLIPEIARHQVTRGGNVIMVQVENEYGSYGSDRAYLTFLKEGLEKRGIDVPLFTSDGPTELMLGGGTLPGVLATVNFGSEPEEAFKTLREFRPGDPLCCMEFWCGWFSHWGGEQVTRDPDDAADVLRRILDAGASVNLYMAHGGTNFGTWAGANRGDPLHTGELQPDITSYDYDAPIDERGAPTEKFWRFREVLGGTADVPETRPLLASTTVELPETLGLLGFMRSLPKVDSPVPLSFEELGLGQGLVLYGTSVKELDFHAADHSWIVDGGILVESMGRTNYGPLLGERKGIVGGVRHSHQLVHGWTATPLELDDISALPWGQHESPTGPAFSRGWLDITEPCDAYLKVNGIKGYVWVNGFLLGRYWTIGPQQALYVPWPLLRPGRNEIVALELNGPPVTHATFG